MIGEKIAEERGRVTGRRVLPGDDPRYVKMEVSQESEVTMFGMKGMDLTTFTVYERIPGQMYGEGRGIIMLESGESAIWSGMGVGAPTGQGMGVRFLAALTFQAPTDGKLARLNGVVGMVEYNEDAEGKTHTVITEWK